LADNLYHPVIYGYLKKYQDDPNSRVFAPLAEAYRKAGHIDEAIDIAREGLRKHPSFTGGKVALSRALFDKKQYAEVLRVLQPVVRDAPDNLAAQRLIAESALVLGHIAEALGAYKMFLYFSPADPEIAKIVQELEVQAYEKGTLVLQSETAQQAQFMEQSAALAIENDPERKRRIWMNRIETLQKLLQKVERYRSQQVDTHPSPR